MVTKTSNLLKSMKTQPMMVSPIGTELIVPNNSGLIEGLSKTKNVEINLGSRNITTTGIGTFASIKTAYLYPSADSVTALQLRKADASTAVFNLDTTNNRIGISNNAPDTKLVLNCDNNALGYGDGLKVRWSDTTGTNRPVVGFYRSRGTLTTPGVIVSGDVLGSFSFFGYPVSVFNPYATVRSTFESGAGGNLEFWTSPNTAGHAEVQRMTINRNGNIGIGQTAPTAVLHLKAGTASADTAPIKFTSGTLTTAAVAGQMEYLSGTYYLTDATPTRNIIAVSATAGLSVTITTAKLTAGGANGSMTFVNGVLTAQTAAT